MSSTPSDPDPLQEAAETFATEMSRTVSAFLNEDWLFHASALGQHVTVQESGEDERIGIPLKLRGSIYLRLSVEYRCSWSSSVECLAIESSAIKVYPGSKIKGEPLFRYDYDRNPTNPGLPSAHIHIHGHRDAFAHLMSSSRVSNKGRSNAKRKLSDVPQLSEVHFPVGGPRFRPTLEDVLDAIQFEFGLDHGPDWIARRDESRAAWRRTQLAAATRDCPEEAARVLTDLGYQIAPPPQGHPSQRTAKLIAL